ncbi:hypothetical protein MKW98_028287 [Papaver atlanticum]|uniref:Uncharacterized protein n=1 Tax=Papaver atlanticum TaxID=357466 RepID=A0AAD4SY24_9MAGN|nr:hypothetical protein MKW98_028287 [Papaver atlanticum]
MPPTISQRPRTRSQFVIVKLEREKVSMLTATFNLQRKVLFSRAWLLLKVFHHMICPNVKFKSIQVAPSKNLGLLMACRGWHENAGI